MVCALEIHKIRSAPRGPRCASSLLICLNNETFLGDEAPQGGGDPRAAPRRPRVGEIRINENQCISPNTPAPSCILVIRLYIYGFIMKLHVVITHSNVFPIDLHARHPDEKTKKNITLSGKQCWAEFKVYARLFLIYKKFI